jgi:hypothetical protein
MIDLIAAIGTHSYDENRNKLLSILLPDCMVLNSDQFIELISLYTFDDGKIKSCILLMNADKLIVDDSKISLILGKLSHDDAKIKMIRTFFKNVDGEMSTDHMVSVLNKFCFDDSRIKFTKLIKPKIDHDNEKEQIYKMLGTFTYEDNKKKFLNLISDRADFNSFYQNNPNNLNNPNKPNDQNNKNECDIFTGLTSTNFSKGNNIFQKYSTKCNGVSIVNHVTSSGSTLMLNGVIIINPKNGHYFINGTCFMYSDGNCSTVCGYSPKVINVLEIGNTKLTNPPDGTYVINGIEYHIKDMHIEGMHI